MTRKKSRTKRILYGKGVWAWTEPEIPLAIDMAQAIGARFVLFKTGQESEYFKTASPRVAKQILDAGLAPMAWPVITCRNPADEAAVAIKSILDGFAGVVFDIEQPASGQQDGATELGKRMLSTGLPPEVMFFTSMPNISAYPGIPYLEMAQFCRGGFMPQAYASFGWNPQYMLDVVAYREFAVWSKANKIKLPLYPLLGFYSDTHGQDMLQVDEIEPWLTELARYKPSFFSVFRAGVVPQAAWPLLAAFETLGQKESPPRPKLDGTYITVEAGDNIVSLCLEFNCDVSDFWNWNGHLWDAAGKPREPRGLEQGWIVRID